MTGFIDTSLSRARLVVAALIFILLAGWIAWRDIPKESEPDVRIPIIFVRMTHEGISPEDAERLLVRPMEQELRSIEGIKEMRSTAYEGAAVTVLEFDAGFDSEKALSEISGGGEPWQALEALAGKADNWLAVTLGPRGVLFMEHGGIAHLPAFPVEVVDTLGAGDVWHGAFALALAEGQGERGAVRFASAVAAIKCTRFGGRAGTPTREEVERFLAEHP